MVKSNGWFRCAFRWFQWQDLREFMKFFSSLIEMLNNFSSVFFFGSVSKLAKFAALKVIMTL